MNSKKPMKKIVSCLFLAMSVTACGAGGGSNIDDSSEGQQSQEAQPARWKKLPIEYKIASTVPTLYHEEIHAGFQAWNQAAGKSIFIFGGIKNLQEDELAPDYTVNQNVVLTTDRSGVASTGADASTVSGPLARTFLYGLSEIHDADIYLFEFNRNFVEGRSDTGDVYSIKSVVMHEAGHMLFGPEHSQDVESIMTAVLYPKGHPQEKLELGLLDIAQLRSVYAHDLL